MTVAKRIDWMDFAHQLDKDLARIQDGLPQGVRCSLSLSAYGDSGAMFGVTLTHGESKCHGHGYARTPAKALEEATAALSKAYAEWQRRPRIAETKVLGSAKYVPLDDDFDPRS